MHLCILQKTTTTNGKLDDLYESLGYTPPISRGVNGNITGAVMVYVCSRVDVYLETGLSTTLARGNRVGDSGDIFVGGIRFVPDGEDAVHRTLKAYPRLADMISPFGDCAALLWNPDHQGLRVEVNFLPAHCSLLLTAHCSLLTAHTHYSLLTTHYSLLTTQASGCFLAMLSTSAQRKASTKDLQSTSLDWLTRGLGEAVRPFYSHFFFRGSDDLLMADLSYLNSFTDSSLLNRSGTPSHRRSSRLVKLEGNQSAQPEGNEETKAENLVRKKEMEEKRKRGRKEVSKKEPKKEPMKEPKARNEPSKKEQKKEQKKRKKLPKMKFETKWEEVEGEEEGEDGDDSDDGEENGDPPAAEMSSVSEISEALEMQGPQMDEATWGAHGKECCNKANRVAMWCKKVTDAGKGTSSR